MTMRFLGSVSRAIALHPKSTRDLSTRWFRTCFNFFLSHEVEAWLKRIVDEIEVNIWTIWAITSGSEVHFDIRFRWDASKSPKSHVELTMSCYTISFSLSAFFFFLFSHSYIISIIWCRQFQQKKDSVFWGLALVQGYPKRYNRWVKGTSVSSLVSPALAERKPGNVPTSYFFTYFLHNTTRTAFR